jgi:hypothetical protein
MSRAVGTLFWILLAVMGGLLLLMGLLLLLGRVRGGRYLRPLFAGLSRIPFMRRALANMSIKAYERTNPELAGALRKMQAFGEPKTPEQAQRALALLTPAERKAYLAAVGSEAQDKMPEPTNRAQRRLLEKGVQPGVVPTPRPVGRKRKR